MFESDVSTGLPDSSWEPVLPDRATLLRLAADPPTTAHVTPEPIGGAIQPQWVPAHEYIGGAVGLADAAAQADPSQPR
jgi:hypothetical protein